MLLKRTHSPLIPNLPFVLAVGINGNLSADMRSCVQNAFHHTPDGSHAVSAAASASMLCINCEKKKNEKQQESLLRSCAPYCNWFLDKPRERHVPQLQMQCGNFSSVDRVRLVNRRRCFPFDKHLNWRCHRRYCCFPPVNAFHHFDGCYMCFSAFWRNVGGRSHKQYNMRQTRKNIANCDDNNNESVHKERERDGVTYKHTCKQAHTADMNWNGTN